MSPAPESAPHRHPAGKLSNHTTRARSPADLLMIHLSVKNVVLESIVRRFTCAGNMTENTTCPSSHWFVCRSLRSCVDESLWPVIVPINNVWWHLFLFECLQWEILHVVEANCNWRLKEKSSVSKRLQREIHDWCQNSCCTCRYLRLVTDAAVYLLTLSVFAAS